MNAFMLATRFDWSDLYPFAAPPPPPPPPPPSSLVVAVSDDVGPGIIGD